MVASRVLLAAVVAAPVASIGTDASVNPIRRVVTMIQNLQAKVEEENEAEQKLFDKFMCYCKTGLTTLEESISASTTKVPQVQSSIEAAEASVKQIKADLKQHQTDRDAAKASSEKATALREKEAAAYATFKSDLDTNIAALTKAVAALNKGASGTFLQTTAAQSLRRFVVDKANIADIDRDTVMAFLQGGDADGYAPQSGGITGILKQMGDTMKQDLADGTTEEESAIKNYDGLIAANNKQIEALTKSIEEKSVRVGEVAVSVVNMKNDLSDTEEALIEDQKFLADLKKNCGTKEAEWDETKKMRAEEMIALADTIKMLNSDDALEMFKKTLPGSASSLVQVEGGTKAVRARALAIIQAADKSTRPTLRRLDFIALALRGKKMGFEKVIKMVDDMVVTLKTEQQDDEHKKEYCQKQFDIADDKKKGLEQSISDSETAVADAEESIATLATEIEALDDGIRALDKSVEEATEQRKEENTEYKELMASNGAAKELIGMATNRLNKFYNPKLYVAPPAREAALVDVSEHGKMDDAPAPPPQAPAAYSKKSEESNGIIKMMDMLVQDLDKEMQTAEVEEKNAQEEYEQMMSDSSAKRAENKKVMADKKGAKADAEEALQTNTDAKAASTKELSGTVEYIGALHGECDWLLQYFSVRTEARTNEIDALGKAKAVLNGADFSLLQKSRSLRGAPTMEIVGKPKGYRSAWDDCGGVGASATMRMQTIAAKIKGWSKPRKFIRNAAQDAGAVHPSGTKPGPAAALTYPAAGVWTAAREGLEKASDTLAKYK